MPVADPALRVPCILPLVRFRERMRFVLIDRLVELERGRRAVATKTIGHDEDYFADHFPGRPVVPGVLLIESMAQTGGWLIAASHAFERRAVLGTVKDARFRSWVGPGEQLTIECELLGLHEQRARAKASISVQDKRVASAELIYVLWESGVDSPPELVEMNDEWIARTWRELGGEELLTEAEWPRA